MSIGQDYHHEQGEIGGSRFFSQLKKRVRGWLRYQRDRPQVEGRGDHKVQVGRSVEGAIEDRGGGAGKLVTEGDHP